RRGRLVSGSRRRRSVLYLTDRGRERAHVLAPCVNRTRVMLARFKTRSRACTLRSHRTRAMLAQFKTLERVPHSEGKMTARSGRIRATSRVDADIVPPPRSCRRPRGLICVPDFHPPRVADAGEGN